MNISAMIIIVLIQTLSVVMSRLTIQDEDLTVHTFKKARQDFKKKTTEISDFNSKYTKRSLSGNLDPTRSEVTGLGVTSPLLVSTNYNILVTARDSAGTRITTGGERVFVSITDHCTRGSKMTCSRVAASPSVLAAPVHAQMADNGDGTYSYSVNIGSTGRVTIAVVVVHKTGIQEQYYNNQNLAGAVVYTRSSRYEFSKP